MPRKTHGKKTKHRGLRRLPDGRWLIRAYATDERTGRSREKEMTLEATVTEAEAFGELLRLRERLAAGETEAAKPARISVTACAEQWLEDKSARVKASTANHLADVLGRHVLPHIGDLYVDALNRSDIERWVARVERATMRDGRPYSRDTLGGWWRVLTQFLKDITAERGLPDPTYRVQPPRGRARGRRERRTLTTGQLGQLLAALRETSPERFAEVFVLAWTGMRPGELYALTWADIDEKGGLIHIRRAHRHGVVAETKTGDPREVPLTPAMAELFRAHRRAQLEAQHPGLKAGLVFPSETGGYRGPESLYKPLAAAAERAGIDQRLGAQVLRRTFNTILLTEGVDRIVLRSMMGHCSEEMTERYAGVSPGAKRAAVERLQARASGAPT